MNALSVLGLPVVGLPVAVRLALAGDAGSPPAPVVDAHVHLGPRQVDRAVQIFDEVGVDWAVNLSGRWPGGPLEAQIVAAERSGRVVVAATLPWAVAGRFWRFPELAADLVRRSASAGARALKIEKALGLTVVDPDGYRVAVDDPWLDPIWKAAAEVGLPVVIHTADPAAFWEPVTPENERFEELSAHPGWSYHGRPVPSFEALLDELMQLVARHPATVFVSVHFGNRAEDPDWVAAQLEQHPNLFVDLAARIVELGRHPPDRLRALFHEHADRIVFGTDLGLGPRGFIMLGSFGEQPNRPEEVAPFFRGHYRYLETRDRDIPSPTPIQGRWSLAGLGLSKRVLRKVYIENATRLFGPAPWAATGWRWRPPYFRRALSPR